MKRYILAIFLCFTFIFFDSCKKDETASAAKVFTNSVSIDGIWELRQAQYGMIPTVNYPSGNGNLRKFSGSTYENYKNNSLVKTGFYKTFADTNAELEVGLVIPSGQFANRIVFDGDTTIKPFIQISNDTLTVLSGFFPLDGGSAEIYKRIGDMQ